MYKTPWIISSAERPLEAHVPGTVITQQSVEDHTVDLVVRDLYLATKKVSALVEVTSVKPVGQERGWIGQLHRRTGSALGYGLRPSEAAVVRGMVLGDRSLMPEQLERSFQRSGITHVLAISGQHVVIVAAVIYFAIRIFSITPPIRQGLTMGLVWLYILIAGAPPSAIRAGVLPPTAWNTSYF
jgi:competence protein ComEC